MRTAETKLLFKSYLPLCSAALPLLSPRSRSSGVNGRMFSRCRARGGVHTAAHLFPSPSCFHLHAALQSSIQSSLRLLRKFHCKSPNVINYSMETDSSPSSTPALACNGLNFSYEVHIPLPAFHPSPTMLCNLQSICILKVELRSIKTNCRLCFAMFSISVERGSRVLLVGANGAGKSTLLRIFAGKHIVPRGSVSVRLVHYYISPALALLFPLQSFALERRCLAHAPTQVIGKDAFHDMTLCGRVTYVGDRWTQTGDVKVSELIGLEGRNKKEDGLHERRMHLLNVLDVDPHWRIYRLSDGQRRRVQILMAMIQPADVLLLDEISTDLDVIGRQNLLNFSKTRQ